MNQKKLFGEAETKGPVNGKSAQRLFVPKLLTHAAIDYHRRTPEGQQAYEIIKKWAALEASGKLGRMKETNLEGEFFADVLSTALGYTNFSQNLQQWDLKAKFPVQGQTADGPSASATYEKGTRPEWHLNFSKRKQRKR